ncbi:MAG: anaerobic sulfatase maturase [Chloroflexi bacterium]|nr:anaerobic sulfatase maturase [Chloroflexota bacterium]
MTGAPPAFHVIVKPTGATCNLDCTYCFFLSKEMLYPSSKFRMSDEVLEQYIRQLIEGHRTPEVTIAWQGGEPTLMGLDFFRRTVEYARKYQKPGTRIEHTIQTNGTLLDDEWCSFFKEHGFLVGISLDGPRALHDTYRVDKGGKPTFDRVMRGIELLKRHEVEFNTLTTVHAANADRPLEVYRFLRDEVGSRFVQFIPIVERATPELLPVANEGWSERRASQRPLYVQAGNLVTERSVQPEQWGQFLIAVFEEWIRRDVGTVFLQMFESALASWLGLPPGLCVFAEECGTALALEHNGDLYSCDHFVEPAFRLGNITELPMVDLVASERQRAFGAAKRDRLPRYCRECPVLFACNGECPRNRFILTPDGEPGLNYLCAGYRAFFTHIDRPMRVMGDLLRRGLPADGIMAIVERADREFQTAVVKAGRNAPCPCGSGQKVKRCHGGPSAAAPRSI